MSDAQAGPSLSKRFEAILGLVRPCHTLVDIGTDHALVPLAAVARGVARHAIAIDRQSAPLQAARANRRAAGLEAQVDLRHGDGLAPLNDEGDVLTIAGLGGRLVVRILQAHPAKLARFGQLVLQPNQQAEHVRAWARQAGWHLTDEAMVEEGDRFFPVLAFRPGSGPDPAYALGGFTPEALERLGPRLLATADPIARRFWRAQRDRLAPLVGQPGNDAEAWHRLYERALAPH